MNFIKFQTNLPFIISGLSLLLNFIISIITILGVGNGVAMISILYTYTQKFISCEILYTRNNTCKTPGKASYFFSKRIKHVVF